MAKDPEIYAHQEWIGFVQPVGLVVSIPALVAAGIVMNRNAAPIHQRFLSCLVQDKFEEPIPEISDFRHFVETVLEWEATDLVRLPENVQSTRYSQLEISVPEYGEVLRPTYVVPEFKPKEIQNPWIMLVQELDGKIDFDGIFETDKHKWLATPHAKFERLLRESEVPIGLLVNQTHIRLVYAPRGETSGYITFDFANMIPVAGRPILGALHMLLSNDRLFRLGEKERLPAILAESRKYQNTVSTKLAEQVLAALYELLRGFQAANEQRRGQLLGEILSHDPDHVYSGLLTVLMRLVFILYAEDRNLLSNSPVYTNFYSVSGLFERLREDDGRYPDTMDHRFGAWSQLLALFRIVFDGASHDGLSIPQRKGHLFDPNRYPFLEGRNNSPGTIPSRENIPHISDGVVYKVLRNLLMLEAERLSYRTLDVEQIGSVYEAIMGFRLEIAKGNSIAVKPKKAHGAPVNINLDDLLKIKPSERAKWIRENTDQDITGVALESLENASTIADLIASIEKKISQQATPHVVPPRNMLLQPSMERRNSGSHYTPRLLTEPIVRTTLRPIFQRLGACPTPQQILDLKVCDPAMGSGAFLVEACRQLGDELVKAWQRTNSLPPIPPDEDEVLHARRLIAQRCLYGVDRNPMAVDLAKLSLWLATLAKDHPFTFLDHTLRCGDSLVGLSKEQIIRFHWEPKAQRAIDERRIKNSIKNATEYRKVILDDADNTLYPLLQVKLTQAERSLDPVRLIGDAVVSAFFASENDRQRSKDRDSLLPIVTAMLDGNAHEGLTSAARRLNDATIRTFHWEIEFPEVFDSSSHGFDAIVGNPPFAGKNTLINSNPPRYLDWIRTIHEESHGNSDLVAHFFRRSFNLLGANGCFGLIATNTIAQGDTRATGLRWICNHGGTIYHANRRHRWPGQAAVIVSVLHVVKGNFEGTPKLDGRSVPRITAYLFHAGGNDDPVRLRANADISFQGSIVLGMGFTFDDTDKKGIASPIADMNRLIQKDPRNAERIYAFLGGEELLNSPTQEPNRYIIYFADMKEEEARTWPALMKIIEEKVKPNRLTDKRESYRKYWWQFAEKRVELYDKTSSLKRVLACSLHQPHWVISFVPTGSIYSHALGLFCLDSYASFGILQSRVHETWARFLGSSMKDDLRYTASDCFETFPFPDKSIQTSLEEASEEYYHHRAYVMRMTGQGLTQTYNKFHDPTEMGADIVQMRNLHDQMDQAVLSAYGWTNNVQCEFILEYQDETEDTVDAELGRKKPWRYRWPNEVRDEVLAKLLELNKQRGDEELLTGLQSVKNNPPRTPRKKTKRSSADKRLSIVDSKTEDDGNRQLTLTELEL